MKQSLLLGLLGLTLSWTYPLAAQEIRSIKAEDLQDSVKLSYVLTDSIEGRTYRVRCYGITPTDTILLQEVRGAVGDSIRPGRREVMWYARKEWERYRGPVRFQVRALPNFSFYAPKNETEVRRSQGVNFGWYGGNATLDTLRIELYSFNKLVDTLAYLNRTDEFSWQVPNTLPLGGGYRIKLIGLEKSNVEEFSPYFIVNRRFPIGLQIGAGGLLVAGGIVYWALRWLPGPPNPDE